MFTPVVIIGERIQRANHRSEDRGECNQCTNDLSDEYDCDNCD